MTTPYYQDAFCRIFCGDSREILPLVQADSLITDPVWPDTKADLFGKEDPAAMLNAVLQCFKGERIAIQVGCDSDPRFSSSVPVQWPFFRHCWLEYACPTSKGRLLYTGDVAWFFGQPPRARKGCQVISGKITSTDVRYAATFRDEHPCPRRFDHVAWIVSRWSESVIVDPFMGIGTTLLAAKDHQKQAIGIEIEEKYCEVAAKRLQQGVLELKDG